ncbi:hypothetical protein [Nioella aestuarii]|uniref:hypothetical protein n=1 Tax=Nioella aestuarii TaxID=1662864 RepID=UPI003D7FD9BC
MRRALFVLSCFALIAWNVTPTSSHAPTVIQTLQEHAEMVATHGHSHGLEEDLMWALHGHSHDTADHDHSQAVLMPSRVNQSHTEAGSVWRILASLDWQSPHFRLERPPRV